MDSIEEAAISLRCSDYKVGWLCALPLEKAVAIASLDERHDPPFDLAADRNSYCFGRIGRHNIVITVLPAGKYGTNSAASVTTNLSNSFPSLRFGLMVGIGGGAPSATHDIRLGDVVVSKPGPGHPGVMQYDFGKIGHDKVLLTAVLNQPPIEVLTAISTMEAYEMVGETNISHLVEAIVAKNPNKFKSPGTKHDILYQADYPHAGADTCAACSRSSIKSRPERKSAEPVIHYGLVASGNSVIKDAKTRDRLAKEHGVLCYEMEAAGIMDILRCLVIRGICDYSDSHKNKSWQGYAAATAAAYAKNLLLLMGSSIHRRTTVPPGLARPDTVRINSSGLISPPTSPSDQSRGSPISGRGSTLIPPGSPPSDSPERSNLFSWPTQRRNHHPSQGVMGKDEILEAAKRGNEDQVRLFIDKRGDPNTVDEEFNVTLLHYMAQQGKTDTVQLLLKSGANPNTASKFSSNTPLIDAARNGHSDVVHCLLKLGADIKARGQFHRTALHMAADEGHFECVRLLLSFGADRWSLDEDDCSAVELAEEGGHLEIAKYMGKP
ncbi:hypothetical protein AJ79_06761 [Helicocarpus griseus UAMH5409]|uniref:Nucleoside phosphorylase domain-containing protein n=1 Tax=Helicocarpus griseus UAMH5409 TaxID=1447875 RepID=A0A2B7X1T3_9EURO|nr:hypothetical protein AJ79_06761 [Helicocarpus griseus UAMH5409]